jgi:hypothetical protein
VSCYRNTATTRTTTTTILSAKCALCVMVKHTTDNVPASISVSLIRQQHFLTTPDAAVDTNQPTYSKHLLLSSTASVLARIRMSLMAHKPTSHAIASIMTATILLVISLILLSSVTTIALALPNSLVSSNFNGGFTGWINQCIQAKLVNNNNNNSSVPHVITNLTFALANARASCTQLLQGYINSNNQLTTIQNQPTSSTTAPPTYPNQYQNPSSYPYLPQQQQSQAANTPTPQYPYQSPYQYPYQQPYPSTSQQQSPATNNGAVPPTSQYPYTYQQPQQQQPQNQSYSLGAGTSSSQYPYQQQPQQPQSSQSFNAGQPSVSTLIIVTHVNSTGGSNNNTNQPPANFTQIVENTYTNPDGYTYVYHYMKGSQIGVTLSLQPGGFSVYELNKNIKGSNPPLSQSIYDITFSGDCRTVKSNTGSSTYGYGTINLGETKTCTVTLSLHK